MALVAREWVSWKEKGHSPGWSWRRFFIREKCMTLPGFEPEFEP